MTFTYKQKDDSDVIEKYVRDGNYYHIYYLDGSESEYYSYNEKEEKNLLLKMRDQAIDRSGIMHAKVYDSLFNCGLCTNLLSVIGLGLGISNHDLAMSILSFGAICASAIIASISRDVSSELKKYDLFLEMDKDLEHMDQQPLLDSVEFDRFYQIPLNINTVDEYSYGEMKTMYKKYNKIMYGSKK